MNRMLSFSAARLLVRALAVVAMVVASAGLSAAAELVMFRSDGCPWCAKWDREIGPTYPKTEFNRRAPLRQVNLDHDPKPAFNHAPIHYTPTFVLVEGDREVGRIEGYPGDEFFWARLENLLDKLPPSKPDDPSAATRIRFVLPERAP
jgi:hypothetical protein